MSVILFLLVNILARNNIILDKKAESDKGYTKYIIENIASRGPGLDIQLILPIHLYTYQNRGDKRQQTVHEALRDMDDNV